MSKSITEIAKGIISSRYLPLIVTSIYAICYYLSLEGRFVDDIDYNNVAQNENLYDFLRSSYETYTPRFFINILYMKNPKITTPIFKF